VDALPIFVNARAGVGRRTAQDDLARVLADLGVDATIEAVEPGALTDTLRSLRTVDRVGVAGGDGTLRTAARALAGSTTALIPFPTGTLNHFARRLGIDTVEAAAAAARGGKIRTLPVGRANDHVFLNTAVIGIYPLMVELRHRVQPLLGKWPAAALASMVLLARWPQIRLATRTPDAEFEARTAMFWVGVGRGSFPAVHESPVPDPGETLEAVVLAGAGRRAGLALAGAVLRSRFRGDAAGRVADVIGAPWYEIDADGPVPIALDGEPRRVDPPVRIRLDREALRVIEAPGPLGAGADSPRPRGPG
jgi:diacylglycerol kinase family enzyme